MAEQSTKTGKTISHLTAPLLVLFVFGAMHLSRFLLARMESGDLLLSISLVQVLVLVVPCMLYYLLRKRKLATPMLLSPVGLRHFWLILFSALTFVSGSLLIKFFFRFLSDTTVEMKGFFDALSGNLEDPSFAGVLLSLVIVPAVCEEVLFRGVLLAEYRALGDWNAILITALCFAMLHFSVENFLAYLFAGVLLGMVAVVSRSIIPAVLLHLLSNALNVFASDQFLRITLLKNGSFFVGFLLAVLFGLSLFFFLYCVEHLFFRYAEEPSETTLPPRNREGISKTFLSPTFLLLIVVFLLITAFQ